MIHLRYPCQSLPCPDAELGCQHRERSCLASAVFITYWQRRRSQRLCYEEAEKRASPGRLPALQSVILQTTHATFTSHRNHMKFASRAPVDPCVARILKLLGDNWAIICSTISVTGRMVSIFVAGIAM